MVFELVGRDDTFRGGAVPARHGGSHDPDRNRRRSPSIAGADDDAAGSGQPRRPQMQVRKRAGDTEPVDVNKIVRAVERHCDGLSEVDPMRVATKTISGLYDGATTAELDRLSIQTAAEMTAAEPEYSRLAGRLLANYIEKEVAGQGIAAFSQSISSGHREGLIGDETAAFVKANRAEARPGRGRSRRPPVRVLRAADRLRPLPAAASRDPAGDRDSAVLHAAGRLRPEPDAGRGNRLLPLDVVARLPAQLADPVQLRHPAHADVVVLPRGLTSRRARLDLRPLRPGREAEQVRRRHRARLLAGPRAAAR